MLIWETNITMLNKSEGDLAYGDKASWHIVKMVLAGGNERKACFHFLKGEAAHLARLGFESIKFRSEGSRELRLLLCKI